MDEQLDILFNKADNWPNEFNLARLGGYILDHPKLIGKAKTKRQIADEEYRRPFQVIGE